MRISTGPEIGRAAAWGLIAATLVACPWALADGDAAASQPFTIGAPPTALGGVEPSPTAHYNQIVRSAIARALQGNDKLRRAKFTVDLKITVAPNGGIGALDIIQGTGDGAMDDLIRQVISAIPAFAEPPPANLLPIQMRARMVQPHV